MKELNLTIDKTKPKRLALADGLRAAIRGGRLKPGDRLPSAREMALRLKMNRHTVMSAISELVSEGWVQSEIKRFYRVTDTLPDRFLHAKTKPRSETTQTNIRFARQANVAAYSSTEKYKYSFPSGLPDVRAFPLKEFKSHVYDALKSPAAFQYADPAGHPRLTEAIEEYLRRVRGLGGRKIVVTNGSQEALFLLSQSLIAPCDRVAVEELGYPPAVAALQFAGAKLVPIAVDGEGLIVDELEKRHRQSKIKMIYLTPLHQYPTTVTLSASRRLQLYEFALKNGCLILEDDYDHEFHYRSEPVAPLASFDPAGIVMYTSTFSKILFPAARVGFMAVPQAIFGEIAKLKRISTRQNEQIMQLAIAGWLESGGFEKHLRKMRRLYEERRNSMLEEIHRLQREHPQIGCAEPDGGMALWLNLGQDTTRLTDRVKKHGIFLNPESLYRLDGRPGHFVRTGFSGQTPEENRQALRALATLL